MAYFLDFDERALKEWRKLGSTVREQLKIDWPPESPDNQYHLNK